MQKVQSASELEQRVTDLHKPLQILVASLDENAKPVALRSYGTGDEQLNFSDQPWQGEWGNKGNY